MPAEVLLRKDASMLYNAWALENGLTVAWEWLTDRQQRAWLIIVDLANDGLDSAPEQEQVCVFCEADLVCPDCGRFECMGCGKHEPIFRCGDCWFKLLDWEMLGGFCIGESR